MAEMYLGASLANGARQILKCFEKKSLHLKIQTKHKVLMKYMLPEKTSVSDSSERTSSVEYIEHWLFDHFAFFPFENCNHRF